MKVRIVFNLDRKTRRAIAHRVGQTAPATHADCKRIIEGLVDADLSVIVTEYDADDECENCGCHKHLPKSCDTCECMDGTF